MNNEQSPAPKNTPPSSSQPEDPGKTLGIVGFILAFFVSFVGLILSIIAFVKSKKAGYTNGLALAGIILGAIFTVITLLVIAGITFAVVSRINDVTQKCSQTGLSSVYVDGERYDCPQETQRSSRSTSPQTDTAEPETNNDEKSIAKSPVTLDGSTVNAACFSFTMPKDYIMSPKSETCQTELRLSGGSSSGVALTSIFVKGQVGDSTVEDFFRKYKAAGGDKVSDEKRTTINGYNAASLTLTNSLGVKQAVYFIIDDSGKFKASNGTVTSYLIYGPAQIMEPLDTITSSFRIK